MPKKSDLQAIHIARQYLEIRGYTVEDVSRNPENKGYALIAKRNAENLKIMAKACGREWNIPDLHPTEVGADKHLVADFLYVVYLDGSKEPKLCIIPREALKPEYLIAESRYRINAKLKKETTLKPFLHVL